MARSYKKPTVTDVDASPVAQGIMLLAQELRVEAAAWEANPKPNEDYADGLRAAAAKLDAFARS
ncbi:MAG TPA: hypothetical protein VJN18_11260 [Polyangiaceae bacterium]|nr:hypothetical protein [Polyangiaceae bacterium]